MSYKLLQISQLSAVTELHDNYDNYPIYKNDLFMITAGTQSGSLSTVKATLQDVTHALYNVNNTQAPILCAGVSPNQRVYFPPAFDVAIGQDFSDKTLPAMLTVNGTISSNELVTVGNGTTSLNLSGNARVDGASQLNGALTVGVNDTGYDVIFYGDTAGSYLAWDASGDELLLTDSTYLRFGDGEDLSIHHDGSDSYITNAVGDLTLTNNADDKDILLQSDNGSGSTVNYVICDGSTTETKLLFGGSTKLTTKTGGIDVTGDVLCDTLNVDGASQLDGTLTVGVDDTGYDVIFYGATAGSNFHWDQSADTLILTDSTPLKIGDSQDFSIYHNGSHTYLDNNTGNLYIQNNVDDDDNGDIIIRAKAGEDSIKAYDDGTVELYHDGSIKVATASTGIDVTGAVEAGNGTVSAPSFSFTSDDNTGIYRHAADSVGIVCAGAAQVAVTDGTVEPNTDSDVDLGTSSKYFKNAYIDAIQTTGNVDVDGTLNVAGETTLQTHLNMGDNDYIKLGAGVDLQIVHNGTDSYISNTNANTGTLYLDNNADNNDVVIRSDDGSGGLDPYFRADGSSTEVKLYFGGNEKLCTKTGGIDVTGEVKGDTLNIDGAADIAGALELNGNNITGAANLITGGVALYSNGRLDTANSAGTRISTSSLSGVHGVAKAWGAYYGRAGGWADKHNIINTVATATAPRSRSNHSSEATSRMYFTVETNAYAPGGSRKGLTNNKACVTIGIGWSDANDANAPYNAVPSSPTDSDYARGGYYMGAGYWDGGSMSSYNNHGYLSIAGYTYILIATPQDGDGYHQTAGYAPTYVNFTVHETV